MSLSHLAYNECRIGIKEAITTLLDNKPNDRSQSDRFVAVTVTELEKALAYFCYFCDPDGEYPEASK